MSLPGTSRGALRAENERKAFPPIQEAIRGMRYGMVATGALGGLGREIALAFSNQGWNRWDVRLAETPVSVLKFNKIPRRRGGE